MTSALPRRRFSPLAALRATVSPCPVFAALAVFAAFAVLATGCSSDDGSPLGSSPSTNDPSGSTPVTPSTVDLPDFRSFIATVDPALTTIDVFEAPGGAIQRLDLDDDGADEEVSLPNPLPSGAPATFLIRTADQAAPGGGLFHEVYLPVRPNGVTGFVRAADVTVSHTDLAAEVSLSEHTLTLTDAGTVVETFTIAIGAPDTPTPTGLFFVKELVEPTNPDGAYGPLAYGLSAYSEVVLDTEAFADGVIGIHGTNREDLLGTAVSHGCVRVSNADVLRLEELAVPLGMPVRITA